ncbi:MAG: prolyl oligopeptidase family serine peptidase [Verrucomicrobiales bacterium]|nr:prolyl oligopeptidase family serine peptidase [Verrucomicrobiales bacterium]
MQIRPIFTTLLLLCLSTALKGDGPSDNTPDQVRQVPPPGIELTAGQRKELEAKLSTLEQRISALRSNPDLSDAVLAYLPDVEICYKAVSDAITHHEFFKAAEVEFALSHLDLGIERADQLSKGHTPWLRESGFVVRGYRSRIDDSVQPYGLEIPPSYDFDHPVPTRLDLWFHGRGEKLSEVAFLQQRRSGKGGKITPKRTIVLHPYGRYSNANRFAGETDVFEALEHAGKDYRIDDKRTLVRGFSMGGASCWNFAVHFPDKWAAAQPGAGFSETADFLKTFQGEELHPTWWEKKLWRWHDATDWVDNLSQVPTIAYSGELDRQKQAADMMVTAGEKIGLKLLHLIGPGTEHQFHPDTLATIESRLEKITSSAPHPVPEHLRFTTYTLRYHRHHWIQIDGLKEHWERSQIEAHRTGENEITVKTEGITAFSLDFVAGESWIAPLSKPELIIDDQKLYPSSPLSDRSWKAHFTKINDQWSLKLAGIGNSPEIRKKHGLQGPIDDAFTDSFLMVQPNGKPQFDLVGEWTHSESARALVHWRKQFRGTARSKKADEVSDEDIASHHLVLWGDPSSQPMIRSLLKEAPVKWDEDILQVGPESFEAKHHALIMIYPNPLNPAKYVVLNSGFTYRDYAYLNNARQTSKLPDWAVIDLREPPTSRFPGKVVAAGFFDEHWNYKSPAE